VVKDSALAPEPHFAREPDTAYADKADTVSGDRERVKAW
jgi:hypothetical protein